MILPPSHPEQTTVITWPPTAAQSLAEIHPESTSGISFLRPNTSLSRIRTQFDETQETGSYDYSDASSINRFPSFHFNLHQLTPLSHLPALFTSDRELSRKVTLLVAVLEVEGPDTIRIKKGVNAGNEVSILKLIIGDEEGAVCKLTAWRDVADAWGGSDPDPSAPGVKRGDVILLNSQSTCIASVVCTPSAEPCLAETPSSRCSSRKRINRPCASHVDCFPSPEVHS